MKFNTASALSLILAIFIFILDQSTKLIVINKLSIGESWPVNGFFRLTHVANTGSAFGLMSGQNYLLSIVALLGILAILWFLLRGSSDFLVKIALGLMLAGASGNFIDRIINGHVTDFVDIGPWYIFNVADSAIVASVAILIFFFIFGKETAPEKLTSSEIVEETVSNESN